MQQMVWYVSLVLMALVMFGFGFAAINSGNRVEDYSSIIKRAYRLRTMLFWVLVLALGAETINTLRTLPYYAPRDQSAGAAQLIEAKGYQWRWELSLDHVAKNQPVELRVTSADVNHGLGIYDPDMHLVAQTQAMPGYTNVINYTFNKEGTYKFLCLEYCGLAHHAMITEFKVGTP